MRKRVLFVSSNPSWTSRLDLGDEMREIMKSLKGQEIDFMLLPAAQRMDLKVAVTSNDIDILHFSGHASVEEGLILRDEDGMEDPVAGTELQNLLAKNDRPIPLCVLNACNTNATALKIQESVGCVISTTDKLKDTAATKMTRTLYTQLCDGETVEDACNTAKKTIRDAGFDDSIYQLAGKRQADKVFDKPVDERTLSEATDKKRGKPLLRIENKSTYDKFFFIDYLDTQIRSVNKKIKFNRNVFGGMFVFGIVFLGLLLFRPSGLAGEVLNFIQLEFLGPEHSEALRNQYLAKPYLDSLIALGAAIPVLLSFFQKRLAIHGSRELKSLQQMKELAKSSDELPEELQERLQKILDQCIRGASGNRDGTDKDNEPPDWLVFLKSLQKKSDAKPQDAGAKK